MDLALIERLMAMLSASDLDTLEVTEGNLHVRLSKSGARPSVPAAPAPEQPAAALSGDPARLIIRAGLTGTFYRAPAPGAEPFAVEGGLVNDGDCLGLIEAMKMLNPVEAETSGRLIRFLLADATPVSPGDALVEIEPQA